DARPRRRPLPRREADDEGHVDALVVELYVVPDPPVLEERLSVVGADDDHRALEEVRLLQRGSDLPHHVVRGGEVAVVEPHEMVLLRGAQGPPALVDLGDPGAGPAGHPHLARDRPFGPEARVEGRGRVVRAVRLPEVDVGEEAAPGLARDPAGYGAGETVGRARGLLAEDLVELGEPAIEAVERPRD